LINTQILRLCQAECENYRHDPGIVAALNGGTHMPFEDVGIMRNIPGMTVIEPADTTMLRDVLTKIAGEYGTHYIRLSRRAVAKIYEDGSSFEIGKAVPIRDGSDVTIIAAGYCVAEAIKAAAILEKQSVGRGLSICLPLSRLIRK
jgi:transketolase